MNLPPPVPVTDPVAVWLCYVENFGNPAKVAGLCELPLQTVLDLANSGNWSAKLLSLNSPSAADRSVVVANRSLNLTQAHRLRSVLTGVLQDLETDPEKLVEFTTVYTKNGSFRSLKNLADLAKALDTTQKLTYLALADDNKASAGAPASVADAAAAVSAAFRLSDSTKS